MAPTRPHKTKMSRHSLSAEPRSPSPREIRTKSGATPTRSPIQRSTVKSTRKKGVSLAQKQAIMENIQLEVTERARRLRSHYHMQAQNLRMTIELRVNRIPMAYRKLTMAELITRAEAKNKAACNKDDKPPPIPRKESPSQKPIAQPTAAVVTTAKMHSQNLAKLMQTRPHAPPPAARPATKRLSSEISGGNKENDSVNMENLKKRLRASPIKDVPPKPHAGHVLSPTSSNTRVLSHQRPASPTRTLPSRPASPLKPNSTPATALATRGRPAMATAASAARAKAATTRTAAPPPPSATRKVTTSSTNSSAASTMASTATAGGVRGRGRPTATATGSKTATAAARRPRRKVSGSSSDRNTSAAASRTTATSVTKKTTVMGTIRKGVAAAATKKAVGARAGAARTAASAARTGAAPTTRNLRKRN